MAIEFFDASLTNILIQNEKCFSLPCVTAIGILLIDRLEALHNRNWLHGDIKPCNIMVDNDGSKLFLVDFGLSVFIQNPNVLNYDDFVRGSKSYMSRNAHNGILAFKNDLESVAFMLAFLLKGTFYSIKEEACHLFEATDCSG